MQKDFNRLHHLDLLRGLIIIFMILDHAMVYCSDYLVNDPMNIPGTEPRIFFSRFASHFCAPLFVFLAGLSAALTENRYQNKNEFSNSLIKRGLVLILLEFTIISWSWSFNPFFPMLYAQVIWAIGWGFVFLGLLSRLDIKVVFIVGVVIVLGHNLFDSVRFQENTWSHYLWSVLHQKNVLELPLNFKVRTTYPILPIIGLMSLAYVSGCYYVKQVFSKKVERQGLFLGMGCLLAYLILRSFNLYGDAGDFVVQESVLLTVMSFLNPKKYPLSLQFMLLTVGAGLIFLYFLGQFGQKFSEKFLQVLGKTSMFSYILHLYLLHLISWLLIPFLGLQFGDMTYGQTLIGLPENFGLSFGATYILAVVVVLLTAYLANWYLPWKRANKTSPIAKYV